MPAGRPTDFRPIYCDLVIEALSEGKSLTAFAAEIGVARSTINYWMEHHPEFSEAANKAKAKCAAWWESKARSVASSGGAQGQTVAIIFGLKNMGRDDWKDRHDVEHSGQVAVNFQTIYEPEPGGNA